MFSATWKLWLPVFDATAYPVVPLAGPQATPWILTGASVIVFVGLVTAIIGRRLAWWIVAAGLAVSFLLDQHRLQPWAYQLSILALLFATMKGDPLRRWMIPFAASVYIYSAAGKFDYQFAYTVGQDFLSAIFGVVGGLPESFDKSDRAAMTMFFPAVELAAGIACLFRKVRPIAGVVLIGMHATLIGILGPWSLDHSHGVLVWNVALAFQAYWWMVRGWSDHKSDSLIPSSSKASFVAVTVVIFAMIAPLGERRGLWDHWLSWSLYSPHTSRVDVQLHVSATEKLTTAQQKFLEADDDGDGWRTFSIPKWSLTGRGVPVYPQSRYQLALVRRWIRDRGLTDDIRLAIKSVSDRQTGQREVIYRNGRREIE